MTLLRHLAVAAAVAIVVGLLTIQLNYYRDYQIAQIAAYVVAVAGLTVLIGLTGQISVGNGAFMAVGAYATALLQLHDGWMNSLGITGTWQIVLILVLSLLITALGGAIFGAAAARLRGPSRPPSPTSAPVCAAATRVSGLPSRRPASSGPPSPPPAGRRG
jgi:branched-chain amino acid transport system permease protein